MRRPSFVRSRGYFALHACVRFLARSKGGKRSSVGSDDGRSTAVIMRNRLGSDSNSSGSANAATTKAGATAASSIADDDTNSIEWLGRGSSHGSDMRAEQVLLITRWFGVHLRLRLLLRG